MILKVSDAGFAYPGGARIFSDISFSLADREVLCILGPNGIGKSTLIRCLANLYGLCSGSIRLFGKEMSGLQRVEIAKRIGYVPQAHEIVFPFTVRDFVLMGRAPHLAAFSSPGSDDHRLADEKIDLVGISQIADKTVNEISGGEFQLAMIARALTQEPAILLLDEPTSHLDFGNQIKILEIIGQLADSGISVIMSSHFPDHAFLTSNRVAIMQYGSFMAYGAAEDVVTEENLKRTYGVDVSINYSHDVARHVCVPHKSGQCRCRGTRHPECTGHPVLESSFREVEEACKD